METAIHVKQDNKHVIQQWLHTNFAESTVYHTL